MPAPDPWSDAVVVVDDAGVVVAANPAAEALCGRALLNLPLATLLKGNDGQEAALPGALPGALPSALPSALANAQGGRGVIVNGFGVPGARVPVDIVVSTMAMAGGPARTLVLRPVDGRVSDPVRQMAANVGHGLRNPLGAITNAWFYLGRRVRTLEVAKTDPRVPQFLDIVDVELRRCAQVVSDLFDFANLKPTVRTSVRLRSLIDGVVTAAAHPAVRSEVGDDLPLAWVDGAQISQALSALVQNAVDAVASTLVTPGGTGVAPRAAQVTVRARFEGDNELVIEVEDNGSGLSDEARARLFEPLFTTKLKGTGLGLALVDAVARGHGGFASVVAAASGGTVFRLRLADGAHR